MKNIKEIHVLIGAPGCGKTHFATQKAGKLKYNENGNIISLDSVMNRVKNQKLSQEEKDRIVTQTLRQCNYYDLTHVYIDGLFYTQKDIEYIVRSMFKIRVRPNVKKDGTLIEKVIFDVWNDNKAYCLWNDKNRRMVDSVTTINSYRCPEIDIPAIMNNIKADFPYIKTTFTIAWHEVVRKPNWVAFFQSFLGEQVSTLNSILKGNEWTNGGEGWSCWSDDTYFIPPDNPLEFVELDELLEEICPTITFLQYKKIIKSCAKVVMKECSDYYSRTTNSHWECNLEELYNLLLENNLIKEPI